MGNAEGVLGMGDMSREPSMEEILSSIRRVIARDDSAQIDAAARLSAPAFVAEDAGVDSAAEYVLELTDSAPEEAITPTPDPATVPDAAPDDGAVAPLLVSPDSAAASRHSLDALAAAIAGNAAPSTPPSSSGDLSVNALVEAALRPMLKQWLDTHLPGMVERMVATEIARITGNRF